MQLSEFISHSSADHTYYHSFCTKCSAYDIKSCWSCLLWNIRQTSVSDHAYSSSDTFNGSPLPSEEGEYETWKNLCQDQGTSDFICSYIMIFLLVEQETNHLWVWKLHERKPVMCLADIRDSINDSCIFFLLGDLCDRLICFSLLSLHGIIHFPHKCYSGCYNFLDLSPHPSYAICDSITPVTSRVYTISVLKSSIFTPASPFSLSPTVPCLLLFHMS